MTTETRHSVAGAVRAEMARLRVSQQALAEALGLSQQAVSRRLAGDVAFDVDELTAAAALLQVDVRDLIAT